VDDSQSNILGAGTENENDFKKPIDSQIQLKSLNIQVLNNIKSDHNDEKSKEDGAVLRRG